MATDDGGVFFLLTGLDGVLIHAHGLAGVDDGQTVPEDALDAVELPFNNFPPTHQEDLERSTREGQKLGIANGGRGTLDGFSRGVVATHGVKGDAHRG